MQSAFPNAAGRYRLTSPSTDEYNCIAWAASVNFQVIWPDEDEQHGWPPDLPRDEQIQTFEAFFLRLGFVVCADGALRAGWEKVALYGAGGIVRHAARQKPNGTWTSKLGPLVDVDHDDPQTYEGGAYGDVVLFMERPSDGRPPVLPQLYPGPFRLVGPDGRGLVR